MKKINPRALAIGLIFDCVLFIPSALLYATAVAIVFGVLASTNNLSDDKSDELFFIVLCAGWLLIKIICDFAAGIGVAKVEHLHAQTNALVLICFSFLFTSVWLIFIADIFRPLKIPLWYFFVSALSTISMPITGVRFSLRRLAKQPKNADSSAPPIPEVPRN
jgi:FlaA1/EpsC-like NDP-sugar epimerase